MRLNLAPVQLALVCGSSVAFCATAAAAPIEWTRTTGGAGYHAYSAGATAGDHAGNVIVTGSVEKDEPMDPHAGNRRHYLYTAKYAGADGRLVWKYTSANSSSYAEGEIVRADSADNVIVAGWQNARIYIVKHDANTGAVLWEGPPVDIFNTSDVVGMEIDSGDNVVVSGWKSPIGQSYAYHYFDTAKYSGADGHLIWQQGYNAPSDPHSVAIDASGHVIVAGEANQSDSADTAAQADLFVIEYDGADGHERWSHRYLAGDQQTGRAFAVAADADGNALVTGRIDFAYDGRKSDLYTTKLAAVDG